MIPVQPQPWWWPYTHKTVLKLTLLFIFGSAVVGMMAGFIYRAKGTDIQWIEWLTSRNLEYDFGWSDLTAGEGSLFWTIVANGYHDDVKNVAKFPLYPGIVKTLHNLSGQAVSIPLLLWFVHQLMVWAGLAETYRFWEEYQAGYGRRAIFWLLSSPLLTLHVWLFDFIEPAFIALIWLTLTLERNRRWAMSSTALVALTMLQPTGIIFAFLIGLRRLLLWFKARMSLSAVAWAWLPAIIWIGWMIITSLEFGQFLAPYTFQALWGRTVFRWPWDRWARYIIYAVEVQFYWAHVITSITLIWITMGYVWGSRLWLKLTPEQKDRFAGVWVMPVFSFVIVLLPFATAVYGANRYALTTLLGIWPLLFNAQLQHSPTFRRYERWIWCISLLANLFVSFTLVTDYGRDWNVLYWP